MWNDSQVQWAIQTWQVERQSWITARWGTSADSGAGQLTWVLDKQQGAGVSTVLGSSQIWITVSRSHQHPRPSRQKFWTKAVQLLGKAASTLHLRLCVHHTGYLPFMLVQSLNTLSLRDTKSLLRGSSQSFLLPSPHYFSMDVIDNPTPC